MTATDLTTRRSQLQAAVIAAKGFVAKAMTGFETSLDASHVVHTAKHLQEVSDELRAVEAQIFAAADLTEAQQRLLDDARRHQGDVWSVLGCRAAHTSARALERKGLGRRVSSQTGPQGSGSYFAWLAAPRV